jgi:hypothetical protein
MGGGFPAPKFSLPKTLQVFGELRREGQVACIEALDLFDAGTGILRQVRRGNAFKWSCDKLTIKIFNQPGMDQESFSPSDALSGVHPISTANKRAEKIVLAIIVELASTRNNNILQRADLHTPVAVLGGSRTEVE